MHSTATSTSSNHSGSDISANAEHDTQLIQQLRQAIARVFRGDSQAIDMVLMAYLAGGHVLIEDIPGVGKTTLARALAQSIGGSFRRLQCTPDLMPSDISGLSIYDGRERAFVFHPGPLFCDILLADELNRTPPRTQSALLEAMSEGQVTIDGTSHELSPGFFCIATQNPVDHVGTYPLPDSQRDRFLLCFGLGYPGRDAERDLLLADGAEGDLADMAHVDHTSNVQQLRQNCRHITVSDEVRGYILDLIEATRHDRALAIGASPRAALGLQRVCQAAALLDGRSFVIPHDVQRLAVSALAHRVTPRSGAQAENIISGLIAGITVPR
ncbi:MAG: MoxR family ATPase [Planctomycetota bacterium]|nr:MAG: MoxR family ATPase [Planctomycetota bacterium]